MEIKVFNWQHEYKLVEIPEDWDHIHVLVLSGDEIVTVDGMFAADASDCRAVDFYDGQYEVTRDEFEKWNSRKCAYDYLYDDWDEESEE